MRLRALLDVLDGAGRPLTGVELADRLGVSTTEVAAMIDALRASGRLAPETRRPVATDSCPSEGTCSMTCPGPDECALTVDLSVAGLQIRSAAEH